MSQRQKFLASLLDPRATRNVDFAALCQLLIALEFTQRIRGSHHLFSRQDIPEILNLQPGSGGQAKPYQVRQVRELLIKYESVLGLSLS